MISTDRPFLQFPLFSYSIHARGFHSSITHSTNTRRLVYIFPIRFLIHTPLRQYPWVGLQKPHSHTLPFSLPTPNYSHPSTHAHIRFAFVTKIVICAETRFLHRNALFTLLLTRVVTLYYSIRPDQEFGYYRPHRRFVLRHKLAEGVLSFTPLSARHSTIVVLRSSYLAHSQRTWTTSSPSTQSHPGSTLRCFLASVSPRL